MAYLLPQRLRAICPSSMRSLSAPFTPMFPARHLPTLLCCLVWCLWLQHWRMEHHPRRSSVRAPHSCQTTARVFHSSTRWKVNFASVEKGGYSLFTMLPGPTGWVLRKLTYLNIITSSYRLPTVLSTHSLHTSRSRLQKVINATQHVPILFIQLNLFSNPVKCLVQKKGERLCFLNSNKMEQIQQFHADSDTKYVLLCQFRISNASAFFGRLTDLI